jgi:AraC-like DNA-binding protein
MPRDIPDVRPDAAADPPLVPVVFSTDGEVGRHGRDLWLSKYESFNRLEAHGSAETFTARNEIWDLGDLAVLRNVGSAVTFDRTGRHIRRDAVDHWVIRVMRSGSAHLRVGDTSMAVATPLVPMIFSLGEPFRGDRVEADWVSLYIPRDRFPDLSAGLSRIGPCAIDTPSARLLADYILALERRLPEMTASQVSMLVQATRSMVAACLLTAVSPRAATPRDTATAQVEAVRRIVRQHIGSATLGPEKICQLAGVSRSRLYRLLEPHGGIARYVQQLRLRLAHAMLSDPSMMRLPIATIAEQAGFFDASAFSRAFRREFGYSPGEARAEAGSGFLVQTGRMAPSALPKDFGALLRQLGAFGQRTPAQDAPRR